MEASLVALLGPLVIAVVAIIGNIYVIDRSLRHGAAKDLARLSIELKIQQLNELYGPLLQLTEQNSRLAQKLREGKKNPTEWRLLGHLQEVLSDPRDGPIAMTILSIDAKIEDLIINKGGLVHGTTPPESFKKFLAHYQLLKMALEGHKITTSPDDTYPREFDGDVKSAYAMIKSEVNSFLRRYEVLLSEFSK